MNKEEIISFAEEKIGYVFSNKELLLEALTHSSYANEMKINKRNNYERLEFLGDAVLEMISSETLFFKYSSLPEGALTKKRASLVCEPSLAVCARDMELGKALFLGKGEDKTGGRNRDAILCDVVEAVLGAIYLDSGIEEARRYVDRHILADLEDEELFVDYKTTLQEIVAKVFPGTEPVYEVISATGPEHDKTFVVSAKIGSVISCEGSGKTKRAAQQEAAKKALSIIKEQGNN